MITFKEFRSKLDEAVKLKTTLNLIKKAHSGQEREPGKPYWTHPLEVAKKGRKIFGKKFNKDAVHAALLHDTIEDTPVKAHHLRRLGYPKHVVQAVQLLSKDKKKTYGGNIHRILKSGNKIAQMVKHVDNLDNLSAKPKDSWSPAKVKKSKAKYRISANILAHRLGAKPSWEHS